MSATHELTVSHADTVRDASDGCVGRDDDRCAYANSPKDRFIGELRGAQIQKIGKTHASARK